MRTGRAAITPKPMEKQLRKRVVFLDRDGVIIENRDDYCKAWEEAVFVPGAFEALRRLSASSRAIVIVTNQSAVGRGLLSLESAQAINTRLVKEISRRGGRIDAVYICPHHPDAGCRCRKPAAGMFFRAEKELGLTLEDAWMIGDAVTDIQAAQAIRARGILVCTGRGAAQAGRLGGVECHIAADLRRAVDLILEQDSIPEKILGPELTRPELMARLKSYDYFENTSAPEFRRRRQ